MIPDLEQTIANLAAFKSVVNSYVGIGLERGKEDILDAVTEQLLQGKAGNGEDLTPSYSDDPYFKGDKKAASRYIAWKQKITPNKNRNPNSPNLYINGTFHNSLEYNSNDKEGEVYSTIGLGTSIIDKYGKEKFAPNDRNMQKIIELHVEPVLIDQFEKCLSPFLDK